MTYMTKDELRDHLMSAPAGTSPAGIIKALRAQGVIMEGDPNQVKPSFVSSVADKVQGAIQKRGDQLGQATADYHQGNQGFLSSALQATGALAGGVVDVLNAPVSEAVQRAPEGLKKAVGGAAQAVGNYATGGALERAQAPEIQNAFADWQKMHPEAARNLMAIQDIGSFIPTVMGAEQLGNAAVKGVELTGSKLTEAAGALKKQPSLQDLVKQYGSVDDIPLDKIDSQELSRVQSLTPEQLQLELRSASGPNPIEKLIQPKRSKAELQDLYSSNPEALAGAKGGLLKSFKGPLSTPSEKLLADKVLKIAPELENVKSAVDAGPVIKKAISERGAMVDQQLQQNPFALPRKESLARVRTAVTEAADSFGESPGVFDAEMKRFKKFRDAQPGNGFGERQALKLYDQEVGDRFGNVWDKNTARSQAIRAVRDASQATLHEAAARVGVNYLPQIEDLYALYRARDNMATHIGPDVFKSTIKKAAETPLGKAAIQATGVGAGLGLLP